MMADYLQQLQSLYGLTTAAAAPAAAAAAATSTSTKPPKVLDTRPKEHYLHQRLSQSVNIQLHGLTSSCYLLPDKSQPFAVVVPSSSTYTVTQEPSQHGKVLDSGATVVFLKGTTSLQEFLISRGWAAASFLQDCPKLWQAAGQLQLLEQQPADLQQLSRRCLFAPLQLLEEEVGKIETALTALRVRPQQQHTQQQHTQDRQQQQQQQLEAGSSLQNGSCCVSNSLSDSGKQAGAAAAQVRLRALDVGCGSGRDVAWLASRQHLVQVSSSSSSSSSSSRDVDIQAAGGSQSNLTQQQQQQPAVDVRWHVTGVDEWLGALERAADLAAAMQLSEQQVQLVLGSICPQSGRMQLQRLPAKSRLHAAQHVSVLHAGSPAAAAAEANGPQPAAPAQPSPAAATPAAVPHAATSSISFTAQRYDLILCVRFLERSLLPQLRAMLLPGGFIVYCTFVDGPGLRAFGRPSGPEHVLQPGELAALFGPGQGFKVLRDEVALSADGRELSWFVAQLSTD